MNVPGSRPASQAQSITSSRPSSANANGLDLNASRLSQYSTTSTATMRLGGYQYPVGSVVGSSGKFVIGDPGAYSKKSESTPSVTTEHSIRHLIVSRGYDFEDWNWPIIRFSCLLFLLAVMIALLAAVIGLSVQSRLNCNADFEWWQGSVMYRIDVVEFRDALHRDDIGDIIGLVGSYQYITRQLGVGIVLLKHFLPAITPGFDFTLTTSFTGVDRRMGTMEDLVGFMVELKKRKVKLIVEIDPFTTSDQHEWFISSRAQSVAAGNFYTDLYIWQDQPGSDPKNWFKDDLRNQYYYADKAANRPILDWGNRKVQEEFKKVIDFWFERGVDGIYLNGLDKLHRLYDGGIVTMLDDWKSIFDKHSENGQQRILMIPYNYVEGLRRRSPTSMNYILEKVHLVDAPLILKKENGTLDLSLQMEEKLWIQEERLGPWICWHWLSMTNLSPQYWAAMEMFLLTLPGTVSFISGQEIGRDPQATPRTDGRPHIMNWQLASSPPLPFQTGSLLDVTFLNTFKTAIEFKQDKQSLRSAGQEIDSSGKMKQEKGYKFHRLLKDQVILERYFRMRERIFYMGYFGPYKTEKFDWSFGSVSMNVMLDNKNVYSGEMRMDKLDVLKGQAFLFSLPK